MVKIQVELSDYLDKILRKMQERGLCKTKTQGVRLAIANYKKELKEDED